MHISDEDLKATEDVLVKYFKDIKILNIWKASAENNKQRIKHLETRMQSGIPVRFADSVKSPALSNASPSNRQPPKGLDACIDKAQAAYDKLFVEMDAAEIDIINAEERIARLERETSLMSEVMKTINREALRVLEMKLDQNKSFEDIGDVVRKSKTAVRAFYKNALIDIFQWLKYTGVAGVDTSP